MVNRLIRYGYKLSDGKLVPDENEASIVNEIFQKYANGISLKVIAEDLNARKVKYIGEKSGWNKHRIALMIEERKYIGENNYPAIISVELYNEANAIKDRKSFKPRVCSDDIETCKTLVYCGQCGKIMCRKSIWDTREKWICNSRCKCAKYIDDFEVITAIKQGVKKIKDDLSILAASEDRKNYEKTQEIMRCTNDIVRFINSAEPNFNVGKKMILECVNMKFQVCKEDKKAIYTDKIKHFISDRNAEDIDISKINQIMSKIYINQDGSFTIEFINGLYLNVKEADNASTSKKNCNKNRRKSDSCQAKRRQ